MRTVKDINISRSFFKNDIVEFRGERSIVSRDDAVGPYPILCYFGSEEISFTKDGRSNGKYEPDLILIDREISTDISILREEVSCLSQESKIKSDEILRLKSALIAIQRHIRNAI